VGKGSSRGPTELHRARRSIWCTDDRNHTSASTHRTHPAQTLGTKNKPSDSGYHEAADLFERLASITHGGAVQRPTGVAIAPSGEIYISDGYGNARVHRFSAKGI